MNVESVNGINIMYFSMRMQRNLKVNLVERKVPSVSQSLAENHHYVPPTIEQQEREKKKV